MPIDDAHSVLLVDDHPLFIEALQMALRPMLRRPVFSIASSLAQAEALLLSVQPHLVLLDLMLPDAVGLDGAMKLKAMVGSGCRIVVVSGRDDGATVVLAKMIGVAGFISKGRPFADLQNDLRLVLDGGAVFPPTDDDRQSRALASLTPAQARVLAAAASGKLNKQIAFEMGLSEPTVKSHMSAIIKKLGVSNRTQAILNIQDGWRGI